MPFAISSPAFEHEGQIPERLTCIGDDVSPPLEWADPPEGTQSFALISDDPDAPDPDAPQMIYVHWVLYNLPLETTGIAEGATAADFGGRDGLNDWDRASYGGPCPPIGRHRYYFKLYALDAKLPGLIEPTKEQLLEVMAGHILGEAVLMDTYEKPPYRSTATLVSVSAWRGLTPEPRAGEGQRHRLAITRAGGGRHDRRGQRGRAAAVC